MKIKVYVNLIDEAKAIFLGKHLSSKKSEVEVWSSWLEFAEFLRFFCWLIFIIECFKNELEEFLNDEESGLEDLHLGLIGLLRMFISFQLIAEVGITSKILNSVIDLPRRYEWIV